MAGILGGGRSKKGSNETYNALVDQITIEENNLKGDDPNGDLSQGAYDHLITLAEKIYTNSALDNSQRSNVAVKLSSLKSRKNASQKKRSQDTAVIDTQLQNFDRESILQHGNNPQQLLFKKKLGVERKLEMLTNIIEDKRKRGVDSPANELLDFQKTLDRYNELDDISKSMAQYKPGSNAFVSDYVAYIKTSSKGEITDVEFGRVGDKTGFEETNGVYGGLQVYGRPNGKKDGNKIFKFGKITFEAPDNPIALPGGGFKNNVLVSKDQQQVYAGDYSTVMGKPLKEFPTDLDPKSPTYGQISTVRPQGVVDYGGWAKGKSLYQRQKDGTYWQYQDFAPKDIPDLSEDQVLDVPQDYEKTFDVSKIIPKTDFNFIPPPTSTPSLTSSTPASSSVAQPSASGSPRTPEPINRAPKSTQGLASRVLSGAKSYLGSLFGR